MAMDMKRIDGKKPTPAGARGLKGVMGAVLLAVAASAGVTAWAAAPGGPPPAPHGVFGPGGWGMGFAGDPARLDRMVDRALGGVNATEAQRSQVKQIVRSAAADLKTQREAGQALHAQSAQLFTAPTIDADAVEALRQKMVAQHDQSSRRMSQAMVDIGRVLTPEQRVQLAEQMRSRRDHMRSRMHERGQEPGRPAPRGEAPASPAS